MSWVSDLWHRWFPPPHPAPPVVGVSGPPPITRITVTPNPCVVAVGGNQAFTADCVDVNGIHVPSPPALWWSVTVGVDGTIGPPGLFRAMGASAGSVIAHVGQVSGSASVTVTPIG